MSVYNPRDCTHAEKGLRETCDLSLSLRSPSGKAVGREEQSATPELAADTVPKDLLMKDH